MFTSRCHGTRVVEGRRGSGYSGDDGALARYLRDVKRHPLLTREEEVHYAREVQKGSEAAKETLVNSNLRFVVNVARQYQHRGIPLVDLISEGNIGLIKAVEKFDPERGYHFTTYAVWWIKQSILKALESTSRTIRLPAHVASVLERIGWAHNELRAASGQDPTVDNIAAFLDLPAQRVADLLQVSRETLSFEAPVFADGDSVELGDSVSDARTTSPEEAALARALADDINALLETLPSRESDILQSRYGLNGRRALTLTELGRRYQLTKERIRQIEKRALQRLQVSLRLRTLEGYLD